MTDTKSKRAGKKIDGRKAKSRYTPQLADTICEAIAQGESLRRAYARASTSRLGRLA